MKMKLLNGAVVVALFSFGCGEETQNQVHASLDELDADTYLMGASGEYEVEKDEAPEGQTLVINTLKGLHSVIRSNVAECAGISAEVEAFEATKAELIESGADRESIKESLKVEFEALRLLMQDSDTFKECKLQSRESAEGMATKSIIVACWNRPERSERSQPDSDKLSELGRRAKGAFSRDPKKVRRGKGEQGPRGHKLPPKEFSKFDSIECQEAVSAGSDLL